MRLIDADEVEEGEKKMPLIVKGDMQIAIMKNGYKKYGIYLFEKPNILWKVATFINDESTDRFVEYLCKMFNIEEKENEKDN